MSSLLYRETHKEQIAKSNAIYWAAYQPAHKDKLHEYRKEYYAINKDKELEYQKQWRLKNWERVLRRWNKHWAKRYRELGYVFLNQPFPGCEGHHVDNEQIINMPKVLHRSIYHRQDTGQGMAAINAVAYNFLFKQEIEAAMLEVAG